MKNPEEIDLINLLKPDPLLSPLLGPNPEDELDEDGENDAGLCDWLKNGREVSRWAATTARWMDDEDFLRDAGENILNYI